MLIKLIQPRMTMRPMDTILKPRLAPSLGLLTLAALTPAEQRLRERLGPAPRAPAGKTK